MTEPFMERTMITQEQIEFFQTNGYLIAGPVLDDQELADVRTAYDRIFNATEKPSSYRNLGQKEEGVPHIVPDRQ